MRNIINTIIGFLIIGSIGYSQSWKYDFGTVSDSLFGGSSTTFLPAPDSLGGTARVRVGYSGGSISLNNPGVLFFGSGSELKITAPNDGSLNKFSIINYLGSKIFVTKFDIMFSGGPATFSFFQGSGSTFSNDTDAVGKDTFTDIGWILNDSGKIQLSFRNVSREWIFDNDTLFKPGINYPVMVIGNNTDSLINYSYLNNRYMLPPGKWDMWVGNNIILINKDKDHMPADSIINSFTFYAEGFRSNNSAMYLDNFEYLNSMGSLMVGVKDLNKGNLSSFRVFQNYPNPFNPATIIKFEVPKTSRVSLSVYNILGELVRNINLGTYEPGIYSFEFDGGNLESGTYIYRLQAGDFVQAKKMMLIK